MGTIFIRIGIPRVAKNKDPKTNATVNIPLPFTISTEAKERTMVINRGVKIIATSNSIILLTQCMVPGKDRPANIMGKNITMRAIRLALIASSIIMPNMASMASGIRSTAVILPPDLSWSRAGPMPLTMPALMRDQPPSALS
jgi:hypothetical protein